jgi:CRISPR-associated protein Csd1
VQRYHAEIGRKDYGDRMRRDAQAAWIRAALLRRNRVNPQTDKEISPVMDPENSRPGYLLGRLMAVLEKLQQESMGDVNSSVIDRFFSSASATPRSVFTRLLKGARHHARKAARDGKRGVRRLETLIDEIADCFSPDKGGLPARLSLEEQGLFVLGYHQQRHALFQKSKNSAVADNLDAT